MKHISKNHPEINPIGRDLILVVAAALTMALVIAIAGMMVFSQL